MEYILHYIWKYRLYSTVDLRTTENEHVEIIDPGIENNDSGPDFFNAKVIVDGTLWAGSVEIHEKASDWIRHGHATDPLYDNVILHIVEVDDKVIYRSNQTRIPQLLLPIPEKVLDNMDWLLNNESPLACKERLPAIDGIHKSEWMDALLCERLQRKTEDILHWLEQYEKDWEQVFYILLCRNFGFGVNNDAFERLARSLPLKHIQKQRGSASQIESLFLGQAGLLEDEYQTQHHYYHFLQQEYRFLKHKYNLQPLPSHIFKRLRLRPNATPHIKLVELAAIWIKHGTLFSSILEAKTIREIKDYFRVSPSIFWETHYQFNQKTHSCKKQIGENALNILLINTVAPLLFAYGKARHLPECQERALKLLERMPPEQNYIITSFRQTGIEVKNAGDTQALIQLKREYCEKKRCLYCRFGFQLLKQS
ncbi:MAG TPA: DUF2851 domain-containing protein [Parabacteroides sp.]|nr:DUF2851 domain-containing protein [Parabacteroides sp.]